MFAEWKGMAIVVTKSASNELLRDKLTMEDIIEVLDKGHDCPDPREQKEQ